MKIAYSILKKYVPFTLTPEEVAEALIHLGFEIEGTETLGYCGEGPLVVGQVLEKEKHPDSDHLSVCKVDVGTDEHLQIVCGASNFKVGDRVPVALEGAKLGDVVLKKTNMRGVDSYGMMCSASELGLDSGKSAGLYILNDLNPQVGTPLDVLFADKKDVIFDVSITSNRGDCLSYLGLARELSAFCCVHVKNTDGASELGKLDINNDFVKIETDDCDFYSGCLAENIAIKPSPEWMQSFLQKSGLHPINNVVDVTNFILLEQGQPLHALDADCIQGKLHVRSANSGECLRTLNDVTVDLKPGMMVICDDKQPLAIAGIMGGTQSGISTQTQRIFLECAHFSVDSIRSTLKQLPFSSDSSYRFERFVDKSNASCALARALALLHETNPTMKVVFYTQQGTKDKETRQIEISFQRIKSVLGFEIEPQLFIQTLEKLQFKVEILENDRWTVTIPSYREDVTQEVDLVEEFIRLWGTDKIPSKTPDGIACSWEDAPVHTLRMRHAQYLSHMGFYECYTDTLQPREWYEGFFSEEQLSVLQIPNPLSAEHACLRPSLVPGLVQCLSENRHRGNFTERLFESGRIFKVNRQGRLCEFFATALVYCPSQNRSWMKMPTFNFYEAQNYVRALLVASGQEASSVQSAKPAEIPLWQTHYNGKIGLWEQRGFETDMGYLDLQFTQRWFKSEIVFAAECFWLPERIKIKEAKIFTPYSECPVITKDLAVWVPSQTLGEEVRQIFVKCLKKLVKNPIQVRSVRVVDVFEDTADTTRKSFCFSLVFGSEHGTLTDEMVNPIFDALQDQLENQHHYQLRKQIL